MANRHVFIRSILILLFVLSILSTNIIVSGKETDKAVVEPTKEELKEE